MSKRKNEDLPESTFQKPLRKLRAISGYNIWHSQYLKEHVSSSSSLALANSESAKEWKALSAEKKQHYNDKAKVQMSKVNAVNSKKEVTKIINHLQELSNHAESTPRCHLTYVLVHGDNHYVGGTNSGVQFLKDCGSYVPYSFLGYLAARDSGFMPSASATKGSEKDELRKSVEILFNKLYGDYVHDESARLPYSKLNEYGIRIDGLPTTCTLKHPSSYGKATLKDILKNKENLKLYASKLSSTKVKEKGQEDINLPPLPSSFLSKLSSGPSNEIIPLIIDNKNSAYTYKQPVTIDKISKDQKQCGTVIVKPRSTVPLQLDHTYFQIPSRT